jgi:hypothetical protein
MAGRGGEREVVVPFLGTSAAETTAQQGDETKMMTLIII